MPRLFIKDVSFHLTRHVFYVSVPLYPGESARRLASRPEGGEKGSNRRSAGTHDVDEKTATWVKIGHFPEKWMLLMHGDLADGVERQGRKKGELILTAYPTMLMKTHDRDQRCEAYPTMLMKTQPLGSNLTRRHALRPYGMTSLARPPATRLALHSFPVRADSCYCVRLFLRAKAL